MANAGRILILPKGEYDENASYNMLDMVFHNGTTWLARKTVMGIEPSYMSKEFWQNMFDLNTLLNYLDTPIVETHEISKFSGKVNILKLGNVITIYFGNCQATEDIPVGTVLFTISEEYRPHFHTYIGVYRKMMINSDTGEVKLVEAVSKGQWLYESITYLI